jgi:putative methylase
MENSKSSLAIKLSKLRLFESADTRLEQYPTDSEIAAEVLWNAFMRGDIKGKVIADLGCGTGILGIGAILLGAKKVFFVDKDAAALDVLKDNLKSAGIGAGFSVENVDISDFNGKAEIVIQNPPFGTREKHIDREFLEKAMQFAKVIYSFHKESTSEFIEKLSSEKEFIIAERWSFGFPLKQTMSFHRKRIQRIAVMCFRLEKCS